MDSTELDYKGFNLTVFYEQVEAQEPDYSVGFKGTEAYKVLDSIFLHGINVTGLLENDFDRIEKTLNNEE